MNVNKPDCSLCQTSQHNWLTRFAIQLVCGGQAVELTSAWVRSKDAGRLVMDGVSGYCFHHQPAGTPGATTQALLQSSCSPGLK